MPLVPEQPEKDDVQIGSARPRQGPRRQEKKPVAVSLPPVVAAVMTHGAAAWRPFLREYSRFILGCLRRLASDHDERMDMYLHVCARLYADDCRRLRTFRGGEEGRPCKFTTWLAAVTMNLGREWLRQARGRRRAFKLIDRLPLWRRRAFEYHFWDGYGVTETTEMLRSRHAVVVSENQVADALGDIRRRLGQGAAWRLITRRRPIVLQPRGDASEGSQPFDTAQAEAPVLPLETVASTADAVTALRAALDTLPERERRCLELRFRDGMTAKQISDELGLHKFKQVYELQARGLARLRAALVERGWSAADFVHMHRIGG